VVARVKDRPQIELVDLRLYDRPTRLVWHKRRWECREADCPVGSWTEQDDRIAAPRQVLTSWAARWAHGPARVRPMPVAVIWCIRLDRTRSYSCAVVTRTQREPNATSTRVASAWASFQRRPGRVALPIFGSSRPPRPNW